ncbi:SURP and G-patch domain-containing 1, partial [Paramuricea clavata]
RDRKHEVIVQNLDWDGQGDQLDGDRGLGKQDSETVLQKTVGTCEVGSTTKDSNITDDDSPENPFKALQHQHIPVTPMSTVPSTLFSPSAISQAFDLSMTSEYDEEPSTSTPKEALTACYENASHWSSRRQILSIFADKVSFKTVQQWIPDITRYRYKTLQGSLCRILDVCSASTRTSLQGLDYFSAEGGKAFDDMVTVVDKLGDVYELGLTWSKEQIRKLKLAKRYFKSDYKVHVSSTSRVPDHCRPYALSLANDSNFTTTCNHQHDLVCDRCNLFPAVVQELELQVEKARIPHEDKEEMKFVVAQSKKNIEAWKAHILRFINQDEARLDILKAVDDSSVLVVLDWAMKFIPRKYRESQADWFGKRGLSWHISVAMKKPPGKTLQTLTLVHVFQKSNQDSLYVLAVIDDVIEKLKTAIPGLKSVSFRQDNAGCYHSAATILGIHQLAVKHNVCVRMDFSDPQGGKGPCDRKAASIKNHMRSYLNSGHDISSAQDMKSAIESNGGVRGVATILCGPLTIPDPSPFPKWEGVSLINDIQFKTEEMKVWRAYDVGHGKSVPYSNFTQTKKTELPSLTKITDVPSTNLVFCEVTPRKCHVAKDKDTKTSADDDSSDADEDTLFTCPEDGCVKTFQRFSSLQKHLDGGRHKYALERESFLDKAMLRYAENLESGAASIVGQVEEIAEESKVPSIKMGWALKRVSTSRHRFNEKQKKYLIDIFLLGEQTGQKADASDVSKSMRKARNADGSLLFLSNEYLTSQQITSFFSRTAAKKSIQVTSASNLDLDDDDDLDDLVSAMAEKELQQMREEILNDISIQHPITYESYNICEMATASKLSKFSIAMLQEICKHYELDTSSIKQKRKQPYIDLLDEL